MTKRRHHYVPQFYMRNFVSSINYKCINIHVIGRSLARKAVPLKDQCYGWKLYGDTDAIEESLARFEYPCSIVFNRIVGCSRLPRDSAEAMRRLYDFVALQLLRTPTETLRMEEGLGKMYANVKSELAPDRRERFEKEYEVGSGISVPKTLEAWSDVTGANGATHFPGHTFRANGQLGLMGPPTVGG